MLKLHIHTKARKGPILQGDYQDAQNFIHKLTTKFGINPRHCEIIDKKIFLDIEGQKAEARYIKLGKRQGSCFYLTVPENSAMLQKFLEENLINVSDIKLVEEFDKAPICVREIPAHT